MTTPEGWYRDLNDPDTERYWDGTVWTERTQPVQPSARPALHPTERYTYNTADYTYNTADYDGEPVRRVEHVETRPPARSATAVEPKRGFNPLWLLLPLLLLLGLWLGWRALDNDDEQTPAPSTPTSMSTTASATDTATDTATATDTETATDTATSTEGTDSGTAITLPSVDEMATDLKDAGVENAEKVAQAIEDGGPYTVDTLQTKLGDALEAANIDNVDVADIISALGLN